MFAPPAVAVHTTLKVMSFNYKVAIIKRPIPLRGTGSKQGDDRGSCRCCEVHRSSIRTDKDQCTSGEGQKLLERGSNRYSGRGFRRGGDSLRQIVFPRPVSNQASHSKLAPQAICNQAVFFSIPKLRLPAASRIQDREVTIDALTNSRGERIVSIRKSNWKVIGACRSAREGSHDREVLFNNVD